MPIVQSIKGTTQNNSTERIRRGNLRSFHSSHLVFPMTSGRRPLRTLPRSIGIMKLEGVLKENMGNKEMKIYSETADVLVFLASEVEIDGRRRSIIYFGYGLTIEQKAIDAAADCSRASSNALSVFLHSGKGFTQDYGCNNSRISAALFPKEVISTTFSMPQSLSFD
ncbi:hypothetical protein Bca4012_072441 [Brassica carinata]